MFGNGSVLPVPELPLQASVCHLANGNSVFTVCRVWSGWYQLPRESCHCGGVAGTRPGATQPSQLPFLNVCQAALGTGLGSSWSHVLKSPRRDASLL